jgi:ABC-type polysaccharide/polyol phosphate export permease
MSAHAELLAPQYVDERAVRGWAAVQRTLSLVRHLTSRHLADRHRGSALGFAWTMLNPLLMMLVYTFVFRHVLRLSVAGVPYTCFFLTNYLAWGFFSKAALNAGSSVIDGSHLIKRAPLPRIAFPLSAVFANAIHYLLAVPILLIFNAILGVAPGPPLLLFIALLPLVAVQAFAVGLVLAALAPRFRDVLQLAEVIFTAWFFLSPVVYPMALVKENLAENLLWLYECNPLVGSMTLAQRAFLGQPAALRPVLLSVLLTAAVLAMAIPFFRRRMRHVGELL